MNIRVYKVKQYNAPVKSVVILNDEPICICGNGKTLSNIISYIQGYTSDLADGKIKKKIDKIRGEK